MPRDTHRGLRVCVSIAFVNRVFLCLKTACEENKTQYSFRLKINRVLIISEAVAQSLDISVNLYEIYSYDPVLLIYFNVIVGNERVSHNRTTQLTVVGLCVLS